MDADFRSTSGAVEVASPNSEYESGGEDPLLLRDLLMRVLECPSEVVEEILRTHASCDTCCLWRLLGEELRNKKISLLDFFFGAYLPAITSRSPTDLRSKS